MGSASDDHYANLTPHATDMTINTINFLYFFFGSLSYGHFVNSIIFAKTVFVKKMKKITAPNLLLSHVYLDEDNKPFDVFENQDLVNQFH